MNYSLPPEFVKLKEERERAVADFLARRSVDANEVNEFVSGEYGGSSADRAALVASWAASLKPATGGEAFWQVVRRQWPSFDRINHTEYRRQFHRFEPYWLPTRAEVKLKDKLVVYRGQSALSRVGLSWTLRREVAEGFAHGHRGIQVPDPVVLERRIERKHVAMAFLDDRDEAEVALWAPPRPQRKM